MKKTKARKGRRYAVLCTNGPWLGQTLWLAEGKSTGEFEIKGQRGSYKYGEWVPATPQQRRRAW